MDIAPENSRCSRNAHESTRVDEDPPATGQRNTGVREGEEEDDG